MPKPKLYHTEAVVLRKSKLGEADSLITIYTPFWGKFKAVAKGAERPVSRLGGHVQPLSHSMMLLASGQNLDIVTQSQMVESFLPLQENLRRLSQALYVAELMDKFTAERVENHPAFLLLLTTLRWLCQARPDQPVLRYFELHLLEHLGYQPQLQKCPICRSPLKPATNFFSPSGGGALCPSCRAKERVTYPLSAAALRVLRLLQDGDPTTCHHLRLSTSLSAELEQLMQSYIRYFLEQEVKAATWLEKMREELPS